MHYDYVVQTHKAIVEHNDATKGYLDHTRKMRDELVATRNKIDAEVKVLESLMSNLEQVGQYGKQTAHVFQHVTDEHEDHEPASSELERRIAEGLTFDDLGQAASENK
jgi:hypothetical protein